MKALARAALGLAAVVVGGCQSPAQMLAALIALPPAALAQAPAKPGEGLITQAQYQKASTQVLNEMVQ